MREEKVKELINKAIDDLYKLDNYILSNSYNINERTVTHRLAIYLEQYFSEYGFHVDVEYNRMREDYKNQDALGNLMGKILKWDKTEEQSSFVYPDIIVHKRDTAVNLVEIEVKMVWKNHKKEYDYEKINEYMKQLKYQFGVYIELHEKRSNSLVEFGPFNI